MVEPLFWDDSNAAQQKMKRLSSLKGEVEEWQRLEQQAESIGELYSLALEEKDNSL